MIKLGITGGIGSGKTYVSRLVEQYGIPVFDCDSEAKKLTVEHPSIRKGLIDLLGPTIYSPEGLNKPVLADFLFASKENAELINAIIHPCVRESFREWADDWCAKGKDIVAMESAILYESGFDTEVDSVLMVHAPLDVRFKRVMERDHTTEEQVKMRMNAQLNDELKCSKADFIIENDGSALLSDQLEAMISQLRDIKGNK